MTTSRWWVSLFIILLFKTLTTLVSEDNEMLPPFNPTTHTNLYRKKYVFTKTWTTIAFFKCYSCVSN